MGDLIDETHCVDIGSVDRGGGVGGQITLLVHLPGEEARCRYGLLLQRLGQVDEARAMFEAVITSVETAPKTYFRAQRDWYQVAKSNLPG